MKNLKEKGMKKDIRDIDVSVEIVNPDSETDYTQLRWVNEGEAAKAAFIEDTTETAAGFMDHKDPTVPKIISDGTNTRIVDRCIQEYFTYGVTYIYRGRERKHRYLTQRVFGIFDDRMEREHREELYQAIYCSVDDIWCFKVTKMR